MRRIGDALSSLFESADWVQATASVLTLLATVLGFIFIWRQIRLVDRSLQSETNGRLTDQAFQIMSFIAKDNDLYGYFYENVDLIKGDKNFIKIRCFCEIMANYNDLVLTTARDLDGELQPLWSNYIRDSLQKSKVLRDFIREHPEWYSKALLNAVARAETQKNPPGTNNQDD